MFIEVDHRNAVRANGSRRQVNDADAGLGLSQHRFMLDVCTGTGGVEQDVNVLEDGQLDQAFNTAVAGLHSQTRGAGQPVRRRVNAHHRTHFNVLAVAHDLDHQVGPNVARPYDRYLDFPAHKLFRYPLSSKLLLPTR